MPGARSLLVAEDGAKVYVATRDSRVFAILDPERDGIANEVVTVASGLKVPNGLALAPDGALLIVEQQRVIRLDAAGRATIVVPPGVLPDRDHHGWRYAGLGPDGKLYVAIGAPCNICLPKQPRGHDRPPAPGRPRARGLRPRRAQLGRLRLAPGRPASCSSPTMAATSWAT